MKATHPLRHGSLFSSIGGFDLAAAWSGWKNIFQVEIDPFCRIVLRHHFPDTHIYTDIKTFNARHYYKTVDIISGGFPASPSALQGKDSAVQMTVTSGRRCLGLLTRSDPPGSLVRTLLESSAWYNPACRLLWEPRPLYYKKIRQSLPNTSSSSNPSVRILSESDIPSSRLLF